MKRLFIMLLIVCPIIANAQSRHTTRPAEPADQHQNEKMEDKQRGGQLNHRKQQPMWVATPDQVMLMIEQLNRLSLSQDKVEFAYFCVKLLPIPAEGIMRLAATMSFDNAKLDFLKEAFRYCPDSYNYIVVEQAFSFRSSAEELRRYIEKEYHFKYAE